MFYCVNLGTMNNLHVYNMYSGVLSIPLLNWLSKPVVVSLYNLAKLGSYYVTVATLIYSIASVTGDQFNH